MTVKRRSQKLGPCAMFLFIADDGSALCPQSE